MAERVSEQALQLLEGIAGGTIKRASILSTSYRELDAAGFVLVREDYGVIVVVEPSPAGRRYLAERERRET